MSRRRGVAGANGSAVPDAGAEPDGGAPGATGDATDTTDAAAIRVRLDELLSDRGMTLTELSAQVDVTIVNLSILKNGRARAIRFTTMARLCEALRCQPGDLLSYQPPPDADPDSTSASRPAR
jgi:putative transcriptional regulator